MKTEKTNVEGTCYIWALPKSDWEIEQDLKEAANDMTKVIPFKYRITASDINYTSGAVKVCDFPVTGQVPEGIDLVTAAVQTLREKIIEIRRERDKEIAEIEEQIKALALIEFLPDGVT